MHACTWIHNPGLPVDSRYRYPVPGPDKNICKKQNGFDSTNGTVPGDCYLYCISPARTRTIRSANDRQHFLDETYQPKPRDRTAIDVAAHLAVKFVSSQLVPC